MQLIIAGKAHPADQAGQALIQEWIQFIRQPETRPHIIFLSDYDTLLAEHLVQGVDVWINTPRRPWEASGTSGMKVLVNGGLNLSELDGWWAEAYTPDVGWALGDGKEHGDDPAWDAIEADALYDLLEREVIPEFYTRDEHGIPTAWVKRMRESMARLTPRFSANRTVREYTEQHYLPAAAAYRTRAADNGAVGRADGQLGTDAETEMGHATLRRRDGADSRRVSTSLRSRCISTTSIRRPCGSSCMPMESMGSAPVRQEMTRVRQLAGESGGYVYTRIGVCGPPVSGLYGAHHPALRRCGGAPGSRSHSLAAVKQPRTGEGRRKTAYERVKKTEKNGTADRPDAVRVRPGRRNSRTRP